MALHPYNRNRQNHAITAKSYLNATARDADLAWQSTKNLNKVILVLDTLTYQILVSVGPAVWQTLGTPNLDRLETEAGVGITGAALVYATSVERVGGIIHTTIWIDVTGLNSQAQDGDIIGDDGVGAAHLGQMTVARNGALFAGKMSCIELPAGGDENIALWSAVEDTGVEDTLITALDETELVQSQGDGTDWVAGDETNIPVLPAANEFLYLVQGDATGTDATYTAGILKIEFWGV